jgi:fatty-acyl-CoA synthase
MKLPVVNPLDVARDLNALREAGFFRLMPPQTVLELARALVREGPRSHLVYTIHGTRDAAKPAMVTAERTTTWGELLERVRRLANHLIDSGIGKADGVAIMLPNRPEFLEANAAAMRIGATISFINPRAPASDARALAERTNAKLVVTHRDDLGDVSTLRVGEQYEAALAAASPDDPHIGRGAEAKVVVFTSGTTGRPKGAVRSMDEAGSLPTLLGFLRTIPLRASDVHLVVCPLYHSSGSGFAAISQALSNTLVIPERFSPQAFCENVQEHKVDTTVVVPTMLHELCRWEGAKDHDLSSLRVVVCTGAALREEVRTAARELLGDVLYDLYGSTEMAWVSIATPEDQRRKPGTVGKPVPGVSVKIVDADGNEVPQGERGEIWASSKALMEKYLDDPELTSERVRNGYVSVKDVGYIDEEGYLYVVDRADDMIISGGVNVYPAETEVALTHHPAVAEVAVVGVPDEKWGQKIVAAVVPKGDVTPDELSAFAKEHVGYAAVPKEFRMVESLPRNDVGKIDKRRVVNEWEDA